MRIFIVGAGGLGRELYDWIRDAKQDCDQMAFLDDAFDEKPPSDRHPRIYCTVDEYEPQWFDYLYVAIGHPGDRQRVVERLRRKVPQPHQLATFVHPTARVARSAVIGRGSILCPYAIVSANAHLQEHVLVNTHSAIGHDVTVGAYASIYSHVSIGGYCRIGGSTILGSGSVLIPQTVVGYGATVGAGAVAMRNVAPESTVYAPPAKLLNLTEVS